MGKLLGVKKPYQYNINDVCYILIPKHPILILNYSKDSEEKTNEYFDDFKEDLGHLSDKFNYDQILGRTRKWSTQWFCIKNIDEFSIDEYLEIGIEPHDIRKIDLLISLLIGSINNIKHIGIDEPKTILDKVKHKILLFDGKQSSFIYEATDEKRITIQGMAGTGKTELLLHKLKEIYANGDDATVAFTCHNKVLANDMKSRVPRFFNFMKVDEQIDWENRMHIFSSWGSLSNPNTGLYAYVCYRYGIPFQSYRDNNSFSMLCLEASNHLDQLVDFEPIFDYIFIDESQDFDETFFKLCEKITRKSIYVAGDIFQNIYDTKITIDIKPNYLLNKCYRTDPKTLMFAHAVGMGLYETPPLNWIKDEDWKLCGYYVEKEENTFILSRSPLRRFEDLESIDTIKLIDSENTEYCNIMLSIINDIKEANETVTPEDIGIVILGDYKEMTHIANEIEVSLYEKYQWQCSKGYETKLRQPNKVYISNANNIKGLEFPFIICVVPSRVTNNIRYRNSIYMALTRSFLTSYFIVDHSNTEFISTYKNALELINKNEKMTLIEPSATQKEDMANKINIMLSKQKLSLSGILEELFKKEYPYISIAQKEDITNLIASKTQQASKQEIIAIAKNMIQALEL